MIALDPEGEETMSIDHFFISVLILLKVFGILDEAFDIAAADSRSQINHVCWYY